MLSVSLTYSQSSKRFQVALRLSVIWAWMTDGKTTLSQISHRLFHVNGLIFFCILNFFTHSQEVLCDKPEAKHTSFGDDDDDDVNQEEDDNYDNMDREGFVFDVIAGQGLWVVDAEVEESCAKRHCMLS